MKNFVGEGTNKVYYRPCANGKQPISWNYEVCIIVFNLSWVNLNTRRKKQQNNKTKVLQNFVGQVGKEQARFIMEDAQMANSQLFNMVYMFSR